MLPICLDAKIKKNKKKIYSYECSNYHPQTLWLSNVGFHIGVVAGRASEHDVYILLFCIVLFCVYAISAQWQHTIIILSIDIKYTYIASAWHSIFPRRTFIVCQLLIAFKIDGAARRCCLRFISFWLDFPCSFYSRDFCYVEFWVICFNFAVWMRHYLASA